MECFICCDVYMYFLQESALLAAPGMEQISLVQFKMIIMMIIMITMIIITRFQSED
jgi:hypothetical protein